MYYIYFLLDPFTDKIRYIGCSDNIKKRYSAHLCLGRKKGLKLKRAKWIFGLLKRKSKPKLLTIAKFNDQNEAYRIEKHLIQEFSQKQILYNTHFRKKQLQKVLVY